MKKITLRTLSLLFGLLAVLTSCRDDDHDDHENEVITTVRLTFTKTDMNGNPLGGSPVQVTWKDADGTGAGAPIAGEAILQPSSYYNVEMAILNELANPAQDLTPEIRNEGTAHQFFFEKSGTGLNSPVYDDQDTAGKPIGLKFKLSTTAQTSTNTFKVILRHEPNKNGADVSTGNITNAGGETDIETTPPFSIKMQ